MSKHLLAIAAGLFCSLASLAAQGADDPALGKRLDGFSLRDFHGNVQTLAQYADKKVVVLAFLGTECPLAKLYGPRLGELAREFAPKGVAILAIDANAHDSLTELAAFADAHKIDYPLLKDVGNVVADQLGAVRTPEAFVLDADRAVRYHGRIDDQYLVGAHRTTPTHRDMATAIEELLAGKPVSQPTTRATGCLIARVRKTEPKGEITYAKHVAKIVNAHCAECHRAGEVAPFPLTSFAETAAWADTIREVVSEGRMPPWFADAQYGKFSNDCSLNDDEKRTLLAWIDNGCPEGNPSDLPSPPVFTAGWRMGTPDAVYQMVETYTVPSEGKVEYQYFLIDPKLESDAWISCAEGRPGNPAVVHHIVLFAIPPGANLSNLEEAQRAGKMVAVYAPGMNPWRYPEGTALPVEAGSKFVIQMHYTPNGTEQTDRSFVGLKFADSATVKRTVRYGMSVNIGFEIPPGADDHEIVSRHKFPKDFLLLNLFPHMHYRGKSFRFEAEYPDGHREVLLDVPHYDFNWQLRYDLAEPKLMPKGSQLLCTAHYDNSEANLANPDPTKAVRFGLQTWEEMMVGYYTIVPAAEDRVANKPADTSGAK